MKRIQSLDVLRGFALCGIIFANIPSILELQLFQGQPTPAAYTAVDLFVSNRFFPIFSLLFGISFALMWRGARSRSDSPRLVLLRRLLLLGGLGVLHQLLQPGEALLPYAVTALVLLLPATFLPEKWIAPVTGAIGGIVLIGAAIVGGGIALIPALLLLGFAAGYVDVPEKLERSRRVIPVGLVILVPAAIAATFVQREHYAFAGAAGLITAAMLSLLVVGAVQANFAGWLQHALAALGRTSLTNYVGATLIITALKFFAEPLGLAPTQPHAWTLAMVAAALILVAQAAVSLWWLRRWRQGPLEAALRAFSWWELVPMRRPQLAEAR